MDRIRNAVTRARHEREKTSPPAQPAPAASPARADAGAQAYDFPPAVCDFDNFGKHRIIANEQDPVLNAYRVLRTRVLQKMEANGWRTLAVVSPGSGAGKTVTAINLAIAIGSKTGSRATLIDLDFYRPSVARYLGMKDFPSVLDFFEDKKELHEIAQRPPLPDVLLLANERVSRRGAEHLTSPKADQLIDTAVNKFASRVVIFDMSPLLGCDDTIAFLPKVDCALLVAASGDTRVDELKEARRVLGQTNILGTVLNKAPAAFMPNQYY
ncbi:CpsD/CapB family tyrosine-protein kinase [Hyphococcus flavus]|uniref:CpsD/CapB family tyrosine-protein kinase n=1 Tax=Hyphococcus flavus TaxID=1866326 RepID=A0AAE9ZFW0_9PROT|nr:CpsD/CapB family tyrosine-protein kinase [Hyphococcus flavus]WDI32107.1 CpsD/CapB family tyrosine-protein kinase [Hyphococcus flavus]